MENILTGALENLSSYKKYFYGRSHSTNGTTQSYPSSLPKRVTARPISSPERCPQCEEVFRPASDPRVLKCSHSFCFQCLNNLVIVTQPEYSQIIKCPTCNEATILEQDGIRGLSKFSIASSADDFNSPPKGKSEFPASQRLSQSFENIDLDGDFFGNHNAPVPSQSRSRSSSENQIADLPEDGEFVLLDNKPPEVEPEYYLPFTISKDLCRTLMEQWISSIWFPPSDLHETKVLQDCKPIYIPFFHFDVHTSTNWDCQIGNFDKEGKLSYETIKGSFSNNYDQIITCASYAVNRSLVTSLLNTKGSFSSNPENKIENNPLKFDSSVNLQEDIIAIDLEYEYAYEMAGRKLVEKNERNYAKSLIKREHRPDKRGELNVYTKIERLEWFVILLPVYVSGFSYCGMTYEIMISGNKGVAVGNRPYGTGMIGKLVTDGWEKMRSVYNENLT